VNFYQATHFDQDTLLIRQILMICDWLVKPQHAALHLGSLPLEKDKYLYLITHLGLMTDFFSRQGIPLSLSPVTPGFKAKPDAHRMYAQDQVVIHTVRM
jgi:hypothetical protein